MKIIHLSVECYPVAKVGGLADVVGSLPKYQRKLGMDASVVMPWYNRPFINDSNLLEVYSGEFYQGSELLKFTIYKEANDALGFPLYLIKIPGKLDREEVYCYDDEAEQWIAFQHAFLKWISSDEAIKPDVINCHDHHVGLIPFLLRNSVEYKELASIKTLFTVHNGQYQGWMNWNKGILLPQFDTWKWGLLDWDGLINPLAAAIKCCDAYSTVSEGYLQELFDDANGLQDLFRHEQAKSYGIVNGIDTIYWNPEIDKYVQEHYSSDSVKTGKQVNKNLFCQKYKLNPDYPLITFIGRFAIEKGADYLAGFLDNFLLDGTQEVSVFILGSGDQNIKEEIEKVYLKYPKTVNVHFGYNESLAHEVYAAADMIIMPSRVEPCGLNQLYALKYGTIPIVRGIGGLKDTVIDISQNGGYGIVFENLEIQEIIDAVKRGLKLYKEEIIWDKTRARAMELDFSWDKSAKKYIELYNQLLK